MGSGLNVGDLKGLSKEFGLIPTGMGRSIK